ncbi:MAG: hypothetical protein B7Z81_08200 [Acidocella sp. 20-61-6]|nr:MAG: hypothetical protein B7Z81_08200 [Acidocella sp. 20-61-6]
MRRVAVSVRGDTARIALLEGDVLCEYMLWTLAQPDGVGDVYTGRITAKLPAMAGSFVDLGDTTGFLPDSAAAPSLTEGNYISVEVTRAAQGGKGPRLAVRAEPPTDRPGLLRRGPGPLPQMIQRFPKIQVFVDDYALIAHLRPLLGPQMIYKADAFDAVLEDEVAGLAEPTAALGQGAKMHIAATAALTAIDIDAGAASGEGNTTKTRMKLIEPLTTALKSDPLPSKLLGFSNLGFAEISRPRIRPALHEILNP